MKPALLLTLALIAAGCNRAKKEEPPVQAEKPPDYFRVDAATAGKITGSIRFAGRRPPAKPISMNADAACEEMYKKPLVVETVAVGKQRALANAFVYIRSGLEGKKFEPPTEAVVLDQRGCMFVPRVFSLRAGQTLTVKNSDPVSHNIRPSPRNNREWNQQQPPGAPDLERRFAYPEVMIPVKCNVHSWMRSYIAVMEHPYFAVTDETGRFGWGNVPPGDYTIAVWHEILGELAQTIKLPPNGAAEVNLMFPK